MRGGLWHLSCGVRTWAPNPNGVGSPLTPEMFYETYIGLVNGQNLGERYAHQHTDRRINVPSSLGCSTVGRLTAGTQISMILWTTGPQNRTIELFGSPNHISLTWLRP